MSIAEAFADIALGFSAATGAGFWDARIITRTAVTTDAGGSIVSGGAATYRTCSAQVDAATQAMRLAEGFTEQDRRILVLAGTLEGEIGTDDRIELLDGPFAGVWLVASVDRDPAAIYFECRGRRA